MRDELTVNIDERMLVPTVDNEDALAFSPGRYRLCFEVASGGMATVYLALYSGPLGFERALALKTIHRHLAREKQFVEMFLDEARIAAHVDHPFVCKVVDFGEARDSYYLAMEYLVGEPLSVVWEMLQAKPALAASPAVPWCIARIVADLAEGLHAAHELSEGGHLVGIVHRDVTPANLFVLYDGTVRVVDFGIAKARNNLHQTEAGIVKGKFAYLSPEQLEQRPLDRRSDVFSLGVVTWEMLTGRRLFRRDSPMETMHAVAAADIEAPSTYRGDIPEALDALVLQALARDPDERFPTARAFALAIENCLGGAGRSVSRAELGEWLDELCPGSFQRKRNLLELTRRGDSAVPLDLPEQPSFVPPMEPTTVQPRSRRRQSGAPGEALEDGSVGLSGEGEPQGASSQRDALDSILYDSDIADEPSLAGSEAVPGVVPAPGQRDSGSTRREGSGKNAPGRGDPTAPVVGRRPRSPARMAPASSRTLAATPSWVRFGVPAVLAALAGAVTALWWEAGPAVQRQSSRGLSTSRPPGVKGQPSPSERASTLAPPIVASPMASGTEEATIELPSAAALDPDSASDPDSPTSSNAPSNVGTLRVTAPEGGAEVWEDGHLIGRTEEDLPLAEGPHVLELHPYDGSPQQLLPVTIGAGRTVYISVTFAH